MQEKPTKKFRNSIILFSVISILIVGTIISMISIYPLYNQMKKDASQKVSNALHFRRIAIMEVLSNYKNSARLITSRTRMREMLELYNENKIDLKTLIDDTKPRMIDAMKISESVVGVTRFDKNDKMVFDAGIKIPPELNISPESNNGDIIMYCPITIDKNLYLVVIAPIINRESQRVGSDVVLFQLTSLEKIILSSIDLGKSGEAIIIAKGDKNDNRIIFQLRHKDKGIEHTLPEEELVKEILSIGIDLPPDEIKTEERQINGTKLIIAYGSIPDLPWVLIAKVNKDELFSPIDRQVSLLAVIIILFILFGIVAVIILLHPLTGKIIIHASKLEDEIARRKEAEEELKKDYLNVVGVLVVVLDLNGTISFINNAGCSILGYEREEIIGKNWFDNCLPKRYRHEVKKAFKVLMSGGEELIKEYENPILKKDGAERFIRWNNRLLKDDGNNLIGVLSAGEDVTERKRLEEEKRKDYLNFVGVMVVVLSSDQTITFINDAGCELLGYDSEEIIGKNWFDECLPERSREEVRKVFGHLMAGDVDLVRNYENPVINRFGKERLIHFKNNLLIDDDGNITDIIFAGEDITERDRAEKALIESENRFRTTYESAPVGIILADKEGIVLSSNPAAESILGFTEEELQTMHFKDFSCPGEELDDNFKLFNAMIEGRQNGYNLKKRYLNKNGNIVWANLVVSAVRNENREFQHCVAIIEDITERKKVEDALRGNEYNLIEAQRVAKIGSWDWDATTDTIKWSPEYYKIYGFDPNMHPPGYEEHLKAYTPESAALLDAAVKKNMETGEAYEVDLELADPKGECLWITARSETKWDENGEIIGLRGTAQDITERKKAEKERESHLRFMEILDQINRAIHGANELEDMMKEVLDIVLSVFNCDRAFMLYPCDPEADSWYVPMERTKPEYPGVLKEGIAVPMDPDVAETFRILLASDVPVRFGPGMDIPLPHDVSEKYHFKTFMSMAIYPKLGKPWQFGVHQCSYARIWTDEDANIFKEIGRRIADSLNVLLMYRDLHESEEKYRRIIETASEGIMIIDEKHCITFLNPRIQKMLGYTENEMMGHNLDDFVVPEELLDHDKQMRERQEGKTGSYERRFLRKDGSVLWCNVSATPLYDNEKRFIGSFGMLADISKRKIAEEEIRKNEERFKSLLNLYQSRDLPEKELAGFALEEGVRLTGSKVGYLHFYNEGDVDMQLFIWSKDALKMCTVNKNQHYPLATAGIWADCIRTREPAIHNDYQNIANKKGYPEGHFPVKSHMSVPIIDNDRIVAIAGVGNKETPYGESDILQLTLFMSSVWSMLKQKRAEEGNKELWRQLLQSQKLESVGRLTGGIAHDFNNILTGILGYGQLALRDISKDDPLSRKLNIIVDSTEKAANLVKQLLAFSRKQVLEMRLNNFNNIVENMAKMLIRVIGEDIKLNLYTDNAVSNVIVDETQIEQVLMNLVVNARDAMKNGGSISIKSEDVYLDDEYCKTHPEVKSGQYVMLSVEDTGVGMSSEVQSKVFEPFFTTKEKGEGTGLGLSTVFGIVKQHNGSISLYSEPDKGTIFKIYIPAAKSGVKEIHDNKGDELPPGNETVLIVDDDKIIRSMTKELLEGLGYITLEASSGEEAIHVSDEYDGTVDVLLTDVVMTGMNGWELANHILKKRPYVKVIFTSGYMDNPIVLQNIIDHGMPFINKPFRPQSLATKLRETLGGR